MIFSFLKVLGFLWPYVKEIVLGDKTLKEAIQTNKMRVAIVGLIMLSFFLNLVFIPKAISLATDKVILQRKEESERRTLPKADSNDLGPQVPDPHPKKKVGEQKQEDKSNVEEDYGPKHYEDLRSYFDEIKAREKGKK